MAKTKTEAKQAFLKEETGLGGPSSKELDWADFMKKWEAQQAMNSAKQTPAPRPTGMEF